MLNNYSKVFEVYNETMTKDHYFGKLNEYVGFRLNEEGKQNDNDSTKKSSKINSTKKYVDEQNNNKHYSKTITAKVPTELKCLVEKTKVNNNSNSMNFNERTYTNSSTTPCNFHEISTKKNELENMKNTKKPNNVAQDLKHSKTKDNKNHVSICKICYLQKIQEEVEQLKARKERTTVYPREFNDYMQYENILEIILEKKQKRGKHTKQ